MNPLRASPDASDRLPGAVESVVRSLAARGQETILPDWPAPPRVALLATTRVLRGNDTSPAPTATSAGTMKPMPRIRGLLQGLLPSEPVWLHQVHGTAVIALDESTLPAARTQSPVADAAVTRLPNVVCAVLTADCLPVGIADRGGTAIGIAHAGWRGLAAGVLEATVDALLEQGIAKADMMAWFGPAIGPRAFEVGADVRSAFCDSDPGAAPCFVPHRHDKWLADLYGLARRRLTAAGVPAIYGGGLCTYTDAARFDSYRRDRTSERMATLMWLAPE